MIYMSETIRKNTKQAEKHCGTCEYTGHPTKIEPCYDCDEANHWEAMEPECMKCESAAVKSCEFPCVSCDEYSRFHPA